MIKNYEKALFEMSETTSSIRRAQLLNNLAIAYLDRLHGNRSENLEQAINYCQKALVVRTEPTMPVEWAKTVSNLATIYRDRVCGDRAENIERAIDHYQSALRVMTETTMPVEWARVMHSLAETHRERICGNKSENIERAIDYFHAALRVITEHRMPIEWAEIMCGLAATHRERTREDKASNLEQVINYYRAALRVIVESTMPAEWSAITSNLAFAYLNRLNGDRADNIEQTIEFYKATLRVRTETTVPTKWVDTVMNLAFAYLNRLCGNKAENIEQAIDYYEAATRVLTETEMPTKWANAMNNLAFAYSNRLCGDKAKNIEQVINYYQAVLRVRTETATPTEWAEIMYALATTYRKRIDGNKIENVEQAIDYYQSALRVVTENTMPVNWAKITHSLGILYTGRTCGIKSENLEQAIDCCRASLRVMTEAKMPIDWARTVNNLANAYKGRICGSRAENIEQAIGYYRTALRVIAENTMPAEWSAIITNLAVAYSNRLRGDRSENIEQAIHYYQAALKVRTETAMPVQWAAVMNNLAVAYSNRLRGDRSENIEQAIHYYQAALKVRTEMAMPTKWADTVMNLAVEYSNRLRGDRSENIEQAIELYQATLRVKTELAMPAKWADTVMNLAVAYSNRLRGDRSENIEQAIHYYQAALRVRTKSEMPVRWANIMNNLASTYSDRICGDHTKNIERAIAAYQKALDVFDSKQILVECCRTGRLLGNLCSDNQQWSIAVKAYLKSLQAAEALYGEALFLFSREKELLEVGDLFRRAAYAQAKVGDLEAAVTTLEQGRAQRLSKTIEREDDLSSLVNDNPEVYQRYKKAVEALSQIEAAEHSANIQGRGNQSETLREAFRQRITSVHQEFKSAVVSVRQCPGHKDFLGKAKFEDVVNAVLPNMPLVYITTTTNGSLVLIVYYDHALLRENKRIRIKPLWSDLLTNDNLDTLVRKWLATDGRYKIAASSYEKYQNDYANEKEADKRRDITHKAKQALNRFQVATNNRYQAIEETTQKIWALLMEPIVDCVKRLEAQQVILIPTGLLGLLPLHAAWREDNYTSGDRLYALDSVQFSYIPNARLLKTARATAAQTSATSLLAVSEPSNVHARKLTSSAYEVAAAMHYLSKDDSFRLLQHKDATRTAVLESIDSHSVVHFSCHGFVRFSNPMKSGLIMAEENTGLEDANDSILSLQDFFDLKLEGLRLAILSACETGIPEPRLSDEAMGMSVGLLRAGAAGVIASLWPVPEVSTMILLSRFYMLWKGQDLSPCEALNAAQKWIRDADATTIIEHCKKFIPELSTPKVDFSEDTKTLYRALRLDYSHPYYWAAFTCVGV